MFFDPQLKFSKIIKIGKIDVKEVLETPARIF
jgi:hypothetical protein